MDRIAIRENARQMFEIVKEFDLSLLIPLLPLLIGVIVFITFLIKMHREEKAKRFFTISNEEKGNFQKVADWYSKFPLTDYFLRFLSVKMAMFNEADTRKNRQYAAMLLTGVTLVVTSALIVTVSASHLWYIGVLYIALVITISVTLMFGLFGIARLSVITELPLVYQAMARRLQEHNHIIPVLDATVDDIKGPLRRELRRLSTVLKRNDRELIDEQLDVIEKNYSNDYISLMMMMIFHVYDEGNAGGVVERFLAMASEIRNLIDYQKTLAITARTWMFTLVGIGLLSGIGPGYFLKTSNIVEVGGFLESPETMIFQAIVALIVVVGVGTLYVFEKVTE